MRHGCKGNKLSRTHSHRIAMLANMASSLILHKRIETTLAKAKALKGYVEPLVTKSKQDSTHSRRMVFSYLQNKEAVTELFREISPKVANRPGGYTRILKLGRRQGDGASICMIELVDFNENLLKEIKASKTKTTRRGRRKAEGETPEKQAASAPVAEEAVVEATPEQAPVAEEAVAETTPEEAPVAEEAKPEIESEEKPVE